MNSVIRMQNAFKAALDKKVTYEIGGYFTIANGLRFVQTSVSEFLPGNTRMSIAFPLGKSYYWHTHPHNAGWWPSVEDLLRNDAKHVLFTQFGTYIWSGSNRLNANAIFDVWVPFNKYMLNKTQAYWTIDDITEKINIFSMNLKKCCGVKLTFVPLFYKKSDDDIRNHLDKIRRALR